ncbi:MAG: hypothetical protein KC478_12170, partial [Bacteriovoracaceae bacterium]|nr:hypothetical protein [Bacteriovoracaceae bacterium]
TKERGLQRKMKQLDKQARKDPAMDYSLKKERELLFKELISVQAGTTHLNKKLKNLEKEYSGLPLFSSKIEKYSLRKKILLEKLNKLSEQISMAKLSYEKVKSSLSHLNANEKLQVTSTLKIIVKTIIVSLGLLGGLLAFLYYKQSLFPVLMRKAQLGKFSKDVATTLSKGPSNTNDFHEWTQTHPRAVALQNFYHKQIKTYKWIGLVSLSKSEGAQKDISDILRHALQRGKQVVMIISDDGEFSSKEAKALKKSFPNTFKYIFTRTKTSSGDLVNKKMIRKILNANSEVDHIFVVSKNLNSSPDGIILSQLTHQTFVFAKLFATTERAIQKFINRRETLPKQLQGKFSFVLTNASAYDDINTFIGPQFNKTGELSEQISHLQKVG